MTKFGLKRIPAPKSWDIKKKIIRFIIRPFPGGASLKEGLALGTIMRDYLHFVNTRREAKYVVTNKEVLINNQKKNNLNHIAGLMDIVSFPELDKNFRILLDKKGKLRVNEIGKEESDFCPLKVKNITLLKKGKIQLNLYNGRNLLVKDQKIKPGDTILVSNKDNKIKSHFKLEKGAFVYLTGGKHVGEFGNIGKIEGRDIYFKTKDNQELETKKKYAYVIGKDKSSIKLFE